MSFLYDVAVPEMALCSLTYESPVEIQTGVRVIVEVQKNLHAGFILGLSKNPDENIKIKSVKGIIDTRPVIDPDLWDMAMYAGRVCLCGSGTALKTILPRPLIMGDKFLPPPEIFNHAPKNFHETDFFNPIDSERRNFFLSELNSGKRTLILFPRKEHAKNFFDSLPENLKANSFLWPSTSQKLWEAWKLINAKNFRVVVGTAGAVFAPLMPEKIIIEDEADPAYIIPPVLNISARSLAGRRAAFLGGEFITGGEIPSLKTFVRSKLAQKILPERKNIILADIFNNKTRKGESHGVEGHIPLTFSLIKNTYRELSKNNNVIWILDRLGEASEVFCDNCGESVKCPQCRNPMRSEDNGKILRCRICGYSYGLPDKCSECGCKFFTGRRPGLESLEKIASHYYDKVQIYIDKYSRIRKGSLILSTRRGLELCNKIHPSLIAWLDLDLELFRPGYDTRLEVFNLLWQSYWRGRENERRVLIQARKSGMKTARFLYQGWEKFFHDELKTRKEFNLPPFGYVIEIEGQDEKTREKILDALFDADIFFMDPGDSPQIYINTESLEPVEKVFSQLKISHKSVKITVKN